MKLKYLYVIFIFCANFCAKSQSNEINTPILANSGSLLNDSLKNKEHKDLPKLSIQHSKTDIKDEHVRQEANLKVSEALKTEERKDIIIQPKK
jgi:hypothetical protein